MPDMSDSNKCYRFYLNCKADLDVEYWYEELESNSPMILTSWATFVKHFHVKWLGAPPSSVLEPEPVISKKTDTATLIACTTPTTTITTAIPAPAIYETTMPERLDRVADARHVTTPSTPVSTQTTTTTANSNTVIEQQDNQELAVRREKEQEMGVEKQDRTSERNADAGEQERTPTTQSESARFDWAADVDEAYGLNPIVVAVPTPILAS
jgi:hypothetical protein